MSKYIYRLDSDLENLESFSKSLRSRKIDQKQLYTWEWAEAYYDGNVFSVDEWVIGEINESKVAFWKDILDNFSDEDLVVVSLWCWAWLTEKEVINVSWNDKVTFIWVDSSDEMLILADKAFSEEDIDFKLMRADIWSSKFTREISNMTGEYSKRVFTFLWNTVGSIENSNIVDILYNILSSWDQLWLDVRLRGDGGFKDDMRLFNAYNEAYNNDWKDFLMNKLEKFWIVDPDAEIKVKMIKEDITNSLKFTFSYLFKENRSVDLRWNITFLEWEVLEILSLHAFSWEWLIKFYEQHWFKCINSKKTHLRWQFLFEKE